MWMAERATASPYLQERMTTIVMGLAVAMDELDLSAMTYLQRRDTWFYKMEIRTTRTTSEKRGFGAAIKIKQADKGKADSHEIMPYGVHCTALPVWKVENKGTA